MQSEYPDAFFEGRIAKINGKQMASCPYELKSSGYGATSQQREESDICKRHWWLAGWHEEDNEK